MDVNRRRQNLLFVILVYMKFEILSKWKHLSLSISPFLSLPLSCFLPLFIFLFLSHYVSASFSNSFSLFLHSLPIFLSLFISICLSVFLSLYLYLSFSPILSFLLYFQSHSPFSLSLASSFLRKYIFSMMSELDLLTSWFCILHTHSHIQINLHIFL